MPTALQTLLNTYRNHAQSEREKGSYFEELICTYLRHEPRYADAVGHGERSDGR
ncbi:MAG: hypothetical protein AAFP10_06285 [Pseudomonadota bacterium]